MTKTKFALATLSLMLAVALGLGIGALYFADATPESLRAANAVTTAPVSQQQYDDARTVELGFSFGAESALVSPASGTLTSFSCAAGGAFTSGASSVAIDGKPVLNLSTEVPLWRDLNIGDAGTDVASLQRELNRLGYTVSTEGPVGQDTLNAVAEAMQKVGDGQFVAGNIPIDRILWLPAPETRVKNCLSPVGGRISAGDKLAELPAALMEVAVTHLPEGLVAGKRLLSVGPDRLPTDDAGRVIDKEALNKLAQNEVFAEAMRNAATSIPASFVLAKPIEVAVVSPSALFGLDDSKACVLAGNKSLPVSVLGSELGQSFVLFDSAKPPTEVELSPSGSPKCK
ncbi:hypothetical protein G7066_05810 [Leucobacter coleopterorum]|uniref:Peptidoglycan binding domain-containing protein n=1 Tax=Leucobacter coleopterorum TaxID=2714933 RepID=A0ABX6JZC4_9MICO|nr:hypothetical protein [Leucobacter coleopterorum]QIM18289.1 hypothetical protein G7066_05810 [Leucobacter coleopterorum]